MRAAASDTASAAADDETPFRAAARPARSSRASSSAARARMASPPHSRPTQSKPPTPLISRHSACNETPRVRASRPSQATSAVCTALVNGEAQTAVTSNKSASDSASSARTAAVGSNSPSASASSRSGGSSGPRLTDLNGAASCIAGPAASNVVANASLAARFHFPLNLAACLIPAAVSGWSLFKIMPRKSDSACASFHADSPCRKSTTLTDRRRGGDKGAGSITRRSHNSHVAETRCRAFKSSTAKGLACASSCATSTRTRPTRCVRVRREASSTWTTR
mmetsp:Transcript_28808/g.99239  ORF Transcript_28808/g.99239 Transcript_28808/m.99239 type:complete len:280 (+) Transcript_28808:619-1458(+)